MIPITTTAEAEKIIDDLSALVERLSGVMEEETALVRAGRLRGAAALGQIKTELAGEFFTSNERLKANAKFIQRSAPTHCAMLQGLQETFRAVLQKNLIVLATTHAVSEGILRRLSGDMARKASPQVYGATGRASAPNPKYGRPLAISRVL